MEIIRNLWRRKFRTLLTVIGISIGIFAFTVMGSMALKFNKMIDGGKRFITGQITIYPKINMTGTSAGSMITEAILQGIEQIDGVESVAPVVELSLEEFDPDNPDTAMSFGMPATIEGWDTTVKMNNKNWDFLDVKDGRMIEPTDPSDVIVVGSTVAVDKKAVVGQNMTIRGKEFKIIGILDRTMTGPDNYVIMQIGSARELYVEANPYLKSLKQRSEEAAQITDKELASLPESTRKTIIEARAFKMEDINTMAGVAWKEGYDSNIVADKIKAEYKEEVTVLSPDKMGEQIDDAMAIFNVIILGSALVALLVGGFSIVNTMVMAVSERTREIGIKKSLGASRSRIAIEYTAEAGVIGLLGGAAGMGLGYLTAFLINQKYSSKGAEIFLLEPSFLIGVVLFSLFLGLIAGLIPAYRASRLKVVEALREI